MMNRTEKDITIELPDVRLRGILAVPEEARGLVIFSHGSGSSRLSKRNNFVAGELQKAGLATLLFDLLTEQEDEIYETRFNIDLLTERLIAVTNSIQDRSEIPADIWIGLFGASTGAASALRTAAALGDEVRAVVSRGGRPDLAIEELDRVSAPVLLIVGGQDEQVIELNRQAYEQINSKKELEIVPGASHLFGEPGKLEEVARLSANWFKEHLK